MSTLTDKTPIEEIAAYLTEKNHELHHRFASGGKRKPLPEMTQDEANVIFTLCTGNKWQRENLPESIRLCTVNLHDDWVDLKSGGECISIYTDGVSAYDNDRRSGIRELAVNYAGILYIMENFDVDFGRKDTPITPEFLEGMGLGFVSTGNKSMATNLKRGYLSVEFIGGICMGCYFEIGISFLELPHIRTQQQLLNLITALFGGERG